MVEERYIKISNSNIGIKIFNHNNEGIGIDLGIKDFAICSNGNKFKNINKTSTIKKVEKKLKRGKKTFKEIWRFKNNK